VEIDDRVTVATPEGLDVDLVVAGLGSRFMSSLVDSTLQGVLILPLLFAAAVTGATAGAAVVSVGGLLVLVGYPTAFDALGGRTPGRRLTGLRLVREDGSAVGLLPAAVRNVLRLVDLLPTAYAIGALAVLASPRNQRLGDLAAGTLVVRDAPPAPVPGAARVEAAPVVLPPGAATWDLTRLGPAEVELLRSFGARAAGLDPTARRRVAGELARRLEPLVVGPSRADGDEAFLAALLAAKEQRG
jgi:uncharacterized RDD family membrane protein YckC